MMNSIFPITKSEAERIARTHYQDATEYRFECGHKEAHGGTVADPSCEIPRIAGTLKFETAAGLCFACLNPGFFKQEDTSRVN